MSTDKDRAKWRAAYHRRRAKMTPEQLEEFRAKERMRHRRARQRQTDLDREVRRIKQREHRANMTPEERERVNARARELRRINKLKCLT